MTVGKLHLVSARKNPFKYEKMTYLFVVHTYPQKIPLTNYFVKLIKLLLKNKDVGIIVIMGDLNVRIGNKGKFRSSHRRCSMKKGVLKNFTKFTGKHLCQSLFFNKVAGLRSTSLLKKRLWYRCFPVNFAKFLRTRFFQSTSGRLLL